MAKTNVLDFEDEWLDVITVPNFKSGLCNRIPLKNIPKDGLIKAINIDIDTEGKIKQREGFTKAASGMFTSCYDHIGVAYAVKDGNFGRINKDLTFTSLFSGVDDYKKMYYVAVNSELYFSNGEINGKIDLSGNLKPWSIVSPVNMPQVSQNNYGSLKKGQYLVSYTYTYPNGYESGSSPFAVLNITTDNGSINVVCEPREGLQTNIYMSEVNGSELYFAKTGNNAIINLFDNEGTILKEETVIPFPPCTYIQLYRGSIYGVFDGKSIVYTGAQDYGRMNASSNIIEIDGTNIGILIATNEGFYVGTERSTYFMKGRDNEKFELDSVLPHTSIPGTQYVDTDEQTYGWLSSNGHITADNNGNVKNVSLSKMTFPENYTKGLAYIKKQNGLKQIIFDLKENGINSAFETKEYLKTKKI